MATKAVDVRGIPDCYKEAVVDSILNNLSARVCGKGEFHGVVANTRPSDLLVSGFLLPRPEEIQGADEETSPLHISTHGVDFHAATSELHRPLRIKLWASVYVRVFPSVSDVSEDGELRPEFHLQQEFSKALRTRTYEAMDALRAELGVERFKESAHPDWDGRLLALRQQIHHDLGLPFNREDREDTRPEPNPEDAPPPAGGDEALPEPPAPDRPRSPQYGDDHLYQATKAPPKWLRLNLDIPAVDVALAHLDSVMLAVLTEQLNAAIAGQIQDWLNTEGMTPTSDHVAYKSGIKVLPSHLNNWTAFLASACRSDKPFAIPQFNIQWMISATPDPLKDGRSLIHLAIENWSTCPRKQRDELELSLFNVRMEVEVADTLLVPLLLDRVKPSYRYNHYLEYPALGLNCGVVSQREQNKYRLSTSWSPRYTLPRIDPRDAQVERRFAMLAQREGVDRLAPLVQAFRRWIVDTRNSTQVDADLGEAEAAAERHKFERDLGLWGKECDEIDRGIRLLFESRDHWSGPGAQPDPRGIPFEAWLTMNAAMERVGKGKYDSWRLFQVAFIIAQIPAFATRIPQFQSYYEEPGAADYANSVTLLYFATGGGKSEAFLGLLLFVLTLDRLRGKEHGVSALMRYPLRLLTLQQARRTMRVLAAGEIQRILRKHPGAPLSLGFWVGSTNTPNWHSDPDLRDIPTLDKVSPESEEELAGNNAYAKRKKAWLKIEQCPFCGSKTVLRRAPKSEGNLLGHYCTATADTCEWRRAHPARRALPFYVVDEDIYAIAPSVLLGTVDKLSVIGQSYRTIRNVFGMFGMAPYRDTSTGHLYTPINKVDWQRAGPPKLTRLFPAFSDGKKAFYDPFPSLLIQDEAHLLEESLGTFAGLFESALDAGLNRLAPLLGTQVCMDPIKGERRRLKVIAASATVSEPERQMRHLYQRATNQFPYPGPTLYSSFYAAPKAPAPGAFDAARSAIDDIEVRANAARIYTAIVTNGHRHTVSVASILGQYHLLITTLYERLRAGGDEEELSVKQTLERWLTDSALRPIHVRAIQSANREQLLSLINLHRIALTYVTNKKGGDQVIDTERAEFDDVHRAAGFHEQSLKTRLISGAVSSSEIQNVVNEAETRVDAGNDFPHLSDTLRSIIATSAVSHGVDVEEFNAMFFAGLPSDIAEYIQASSRVGRTHVGFSLLIPVPQRQRDRFVVEIFDVYHRFLERMVVPAAVDRWAEKAIRRVMPSVTQEYLCGISRFRELAAIADARKDSVPDMRSTKDAKAFLDSTTYRSDLVAFLLEALGLLERPPVEAADFYHSMVTHEVATYREKMADTQMGARALNKFFETWKRELRPMISLRDVDLPGVISESFSDAWGHLLKQGASADVMGFIRSGLVGELDEEEDSPEDPE